MSKPYETILCIDFETKWASKETSPFGQYTLSKMTTESYVRDLRFHAFGACIHEVGSGMPIQWYTHTELRKILSMYDWRKTAVVGHNAMFDAGILAFIYDVHPCFIFDTLSMARAIRGAEAGNSLAKLAEAYGFAPKGRAVHSTDGLELLTPEIERELADYCKHDVWLCEQIFGKLLMRVYPDGSTAGPFPTKELRLIDMTLRMFTQPVLELDKGMLEVALEEDGKKLQTALARVGVEATSLASNGQFAEVLRSVGVEPPQKVSKVTGKLAWAFAKSDAMFQAILNGDNDEASLLCEARLRVKSTQERTRAQRFIEIADRGSLPVPLSYYAASSGRWGGTQQVNLQNMKRGSALRKAIKAPEGHVVVVGDLSQIEPRVLAWLADYEDMLDIFRAGGDPYATFGATMFGIPGMTKESHPLLRQSAKSALLGCFGSRTPVLTKRGWVTIVDVTNEDLLWDGTEWVEHHGLLVQGEREVLIARGLCATSDHEILTVHGWQEWHEVLQNNSLFQSALSLVSLPALDGSIASINGGKSAINPACAAPADGKAPWIDTTSNAVQAHAAEPARGRSLSLSGGRIKAILPCAQTIHTATDCLIASVRSLFAALTPPVRRIRITVGEVLRYIQSGLLTASVSLRTSSRSMDGIARSFSLTASTTTTGTGQETSASLHEASTWQISERQPPEKSSHSAVPLKPLRQRMQTYDIALAGPRNRYTILTDEGPIIVHNCGFGLGFKNFAAQLLTGFLGAPPVRYTKADAKQLGVGQRQVQDFIGNGENLKQMETIAHTCTDEELLIHCIAAKAIIDKYRAAAHPVVSLWRMLQNLITHSLIEGNEYVHKGVLTFRKEEIEMVNGMRLRYPDIRAEKDAKGRTTYSFADGRGRGNLYAGRVCNNITQGLARIVMTEGMLRCAKQHRPLLTVHDEFAIVVPEEQALEAKKFVHASMTQAPKWMPGIYLESDVGFNRSYGLAK